MVLSCTFCETFKQNTPDDCFCQFLHLAWFMVGVFTVYLHIKHLKKQDTQFRKNFKKVIVSVF